MSEVLDDFSTSSLAAAIEANLFAYPRYLSSSPSVEVYDSRELTYFISGVPHPGMNGIVHTQLRPENADDAIDETLGHFKSRQVPFAWWVDSATQPPDLPRRLEAHGLAYHEDLPGMAIDLLALKEDSTPPAGLTIQTVGDEDALAQWVSAVVIGFGMPASGEDTCFDLFASVGFDLPLRNYLGLLGRKPVAASQLFLATGVAGIYFVATVPEARRQGIGAAMTLAPLREALAMGYRIGTLQSSEVGLGVYRRLGFEEYCRFSCGVWMGEAR